MLGVGSIPGSDTNTIFQFTHQQNGSGNGSSVIGIWGGGK